MPTLKEPELDQILAFCAEDPVERVFLEDVARRGLGGFPGRGPGAARRGLGVFTAVESGGRRQALCHVGSNVVPSGRGCDAFEEVAAAGHARMVIGDERAVTELWDAVRERLP